MRCLTVLLSFAEGRHSGSLGSRVVVYDSEEGCLAHPLYGIRLFQVSVLYLNRRMTKPTK